MQPIEQQVILVTGSTDGIGKITALKLAQQGATVLIHGRSEEKCEATLSDIRAQVKDAKLQSYTADLSSLQKIRQLAEHIHSDHASLDILINNAGVLPGKQSGGKRLLSEDGYQICFAINFLAPFLLTQQLLPLLQSAPSARIVNVSSVAQKRLDFNDIMLENGYAPFSAYAHSKLALTMFTFELAEKLRNDNITVNCLHPGTLLDTKMVRESEWAPQGTAESGADAEVYLATSPALDGVSGKYFDVKKKEQAHEQAYEKDARARLWQLAKQLTT